MLNPRGVPLPPERETRSLGAFPTCLGPGWPAVFIRGSSPHLLPKPSARARAVFRQFFNRTPNPSPSAYKPSPLPLFISRTARNSDKRKRRDKDKRARSVAYPYCTNYKEEEEMVTGFRRSLSLPGPNHGSPGPKGRTRLEKACHVRSTSLPCRSHPAIAGLENEILALRAWRSRPEPESGSPAWISAGLDRIDLLHTSLDDLLQLPQAQDHLRRPSSAPWTDRLLDDFLRFADAYGSFRSALMSLKQTQSELQTAIRRRDEARLASSLRSQKRIEKHLAKLAVSIREAPRTPAPAVATDTAEAEMAGIMREVTAATVAASAAVFLGIAAVASAASAVAASTSRASSWVVGPLRKLSLSPSSSFKKRDWEDWENRASERLEKLEECVEALESKSETVFRSLVNTRVWLLNILTPSL